MRGTGADALVDFRRYCPLVFLEEYQMVLQAASTAVTPVFDGTRAVKEQMAQEVTREILRAKAGPPARVAGRPVDGGARRSRAARQARLTIDPSAVGPVAQHGR